MILRVPRSLDDLDWPVVTERLTLRPAEPRDAAATYAFRTLPEVAQWLTHRPDDLVAWTDGFAERLATTLVIEREGQLVGDLMLRVEDAWAQAEVRAQAAGAQAELGWVLDPAHAGQGFGTEAVRALLGIAFDALGVRRVTALCFADNAASWRLMERVGMRREQHTVRDSLHRSGAWLDGFGYALLREEWLSSRASSTRDR